MRAHEPAGRRHATGSGEPGSEIQAQKVARSSRGWKAAGALLIFLGVGLAAAVVSVQVIPVGAWLIEALENRFPPPRLPNSVYGVVAISGEWFGERTMPLVMLSREYPDAIVLYSGAAAQQDPVQRFAHFGGDSGRLLVEGRSSDTYENAQFSAALVKPTAQQLWLLITSAYHMPRAVGSLRRAGFRVQAYPVDYLHPQARYGFAHREQNWSQLKFALREWGALAAYWLLGRTDALFPGP
jgi:uncharacterized SAM-binding protein YcdF (DUF218 family)